MKIMNKRLGWAVLSGGIALSLLSISSVADVVRIPLGQQGAAWGVQTPSMGKTKNQVEYNYGAPISKTGPVGDPPIYKWEYKSFNVYFEGEHVIHSVVKKIEQ